MRAYAHLCVCERERVRHVGTKKSLTSARSNLRPLIPHSLDTLVSSNSSLALELVVHCSTPSASPKTAFPVHNLD
eukprot:4601636-Pleurochrysis_carterae.AAC.1